MIVCGTGHRPDKLGGYSIEVINNLTQLASDWLREHKPTKVISGMALGWDTALASAAVSNEIPLVAAIPFRGQESRWPDESQKEFNRLTDKAQVIVYVSEGGYAPWKMQVRNKWMVDHADVVLALYNGDASGGTYNCLEYAKKQQKQIVNLWETYVDLKERNLPHDRSGK